MKKSSGVWLLSMAVTLLFPIVGKTADVEQPLRQAFSSAKVSADRQGRPNILLILLDDMGYGDFGFDGMELIKVTEYLPFGFG